MTETDTIKVREVDKERLDDLMEGDEITEYGTLSYADAVKFVLDQYEAGNTRSTSGDSTGSSGVNKRSADGSQDDTSSDEVEEKINSVRLEDGGGTRNNDNIPQGGDAEEASFPDEDEEETQSLSAEELKARSQR